MGRELIYMNNAATTLKKPDCVYKAFIDAAKQYSNMGRGASLLSIETSKAAFNARKSVAALFGIKNPLRVGFMKNATEALNTGIYGLLNAGDHVISTVSDHNAVLRPLARVRDEKGVEVTLLPVDALGRICPGDFTKALKKNTKMIVMSQASNVTGNVFDIKAIGTIARDHGAWFFLDTAQSAGILDIDVERDNIDLMAFTAHKHLFAFQGLGGLYLREGIPMKPLIVGGGMGNAGDLSYMPEMPELVEAGTQNMPGIAALDASVRFIMENRDAIAGKEEELTRYFLEKIGEKDGLRVLGEPAAQNRIAVFSLVSEKYSILDLASYLDREKGIETRYGMHCAPLIHRFLGSDDTGTLRISLCFFNQKEEIDALLDAVDSF